MDSPQQSQGSKQNIILAKAPCFFFFPVFFPSRLLCLDKVEVNERHWAMYKKTVHSRLPGDLCPLPACCPFCCSGDRPVPRECGMHLWRTRSPQSTTDYKSWYPNSHFQALSGASAVPGQSPSRSCFSFHFGSFRKMSNPTSLLEWEIICSQPICVSLAFLSCYCFTIRFLLLRLSVAPGLLCNTGNVKLVFWGCLASWPQKSSSKMT